MITLKNISKEYNDTKILEDFNFVINKGEMIFITGESGIGKTTLLNIMSLLERPDSGDVIVENVVNPNKKSVLNLRRNMFGYLFQNYALIENETVEDNLLLALKYRRNIDKKAEIEKVLYDVNLKNFNKKKIFMLSGGEQQRVALARIMLKQCEYIFADEPTGNLDNKNRDIVFDILKSINLLDKTIVIVTHDKELIKQSDKIINLKSNAIQF